MKKIKPFLVFAIITSSMNLYAQNNLYPTSGDVKIYNYSPSLILQRNTTIGGFTQGIQTRLADGTNGWFFGTLHGNDWRICKGDGEGDAKLVVTSLGNIGLGTTNPESIFTVQKSVSGGRGGEISIINWASQTIGNEAALNFGLENSSYGGNDGNAQIKARLSGLSGASTDMIFSLWSGSSFNEYLRIQSNGNIGIGTATPSKKLTVIGGSEVVSYFEAANSGYAALTFSGNGGVTKAALTTYNGNIYFGRLNSTQTGSCEDLIINSNGNVGIGTTTPDGLLTIGENNQVLNFLSNKKLTGSWPPVAENSTFTIQSSGYHAGNMAFATGNAEVMRITSNGNIGIGLTNPQYKLTVEGTIAAREVKVTAESWSDFVFHPTYKLRTLVEVEQYIKTNSHLPEIPTEAEVKQNGVDLGEMNAKLLQKVEELTLYMIEQQKTIEKQNLRIEKLEKTTNK